MPAKTLTFKRLRFTNPYKRFQQNFKRDAEALPKAEAAFTWATARGSMRPAPKKPKQKFGRFGFQKAYTQKAYNNRVAKYGKNTPKTFLRKGLYSPPGHPPFNHTKGFSLKSMKFVPIGGGADIPHARPTGGRVLAWRVGPIMNTRKSWTKPVPALHEYGGTVRINKQASTYTDRGWTLQRKNRGTGTAVYPERPYMRPAAEKARRDVKAKFGGSIPRLTKMGNVDKTNGIRAWRKY